VTRAGAFAAGFFLTAVWAAPGYVMVLMYCPQAIWPGLWGGAAFAAFALTLAGGGFAGVMTRGYRVKVRADRKAGISPPQRWMRGACWPALEEPSKRELPDIGSPKGSSR
jgi:hypothetical protein